MNAVTAVPMPDGRTLVASGGSDETVWLWDPEIGRQVGPSLTGHYGSVNAVIAVPMPDGRTLVASGGSDDETVRLWDPEIGRQVGPSLTGHYGSVNAVIAVPMPDGRILVASGSSDHTVRLWDPIEGTVEGIAILGAPVDALAELREEPKPRLVIAGQEGLLLIELSRPEAPRMQAQI
ncbi:WD40 repeat domain-containing protein [Nocardia sp. NPDC050412]|uniref:WD40 repeat domain-containing protein n=1 Tax=Nocardia sp. NPDC050412 TaxID=3364320 RepID=UPI00379763DF